MDGDLSSRRCAPCEGGVSPLTPSQIEELLARVPGWRVDGNSIVREFSFKGYARTVAFVNAVVWIALTEDHHPEIAFGYKFCTIRYTTHAIGGLSENDFICAAKINALWQAGT
ncbi:MAG: 4a-hydroxytetrahydrobiopterin dehydratase [Kiritimatiellae bacterium]|nr:4a-hydroxytetrahydrobiopterin dehydratase [Kiritimatiellia bacterium]MDW8457669.1 4a-hydroxytetrahydrobiopterin dehydratase [Verrucomicrobiota bacterium]